MTREDTRIIFSNISDLAEFADEFVARLEIALGSVVPNGEGEDAVGALFIETVRSPSYPSRHMTNTPKLPLMEPQYKLYITHHPAALAHLGSLPQTPALAAYHNTTRTLAQQLSPVWDLPSLLIKPVQRLLKYALLLHAIIEETPDSHGDKENLRRAKAMVEDILRAINEDHHRRDIVQEVFAAGKPTEVIKLKGLGIMDRVRGAVGRNITQDGSDEAVRVAQMERDISRIDAFIRQFTKETVKWVKSMRALMTALRVWAKSFARVIGLGPDETSKVLDAFSAVVDKKLPPIGTKLKDVVREQLLPQLSMLLDTIKRPTLLLDTLHALEPHHFASLQLISAKGRPPPALKEASIAYVGLRAQLIAELPAYLKLLNAGVTLCVRWLAKMQGRLWRDVRTRWSELWNDLRVEGNMKTGSKELVSVWEARREEATRDLRTLSIISPEKITSRSKQVRFTTSPPSTTERKAIKTTKNSLEPTRNAPADSTPSISARRKCASDASASAGRLGHQPSAESAPPTRSTQSSSGGHRQSDEATPVHPLPKPAIPRQQSIPTPLRCVRPSNSYHTHHAPPLPPFMLPESQMRMSRRWYHAQALCLCRVIHECDPPQAQYYGLPFFRLSLNNVYHVLKLFGHPSRHRELPVRTDEDEECLVLARDDTGELGWILASFLFPVD